MKSIWISALALFFLTGCKSQQSLLGTWQQLDTSVDGYRPMVEFDSTDYTFIIDGKPPLNRSYHIYEDYIVGPEHPVLKTRDSIRFQHISKDTIILHLKEKGVRYPRKYYRLE